MARIISYKLQHAHELRDWTVLILRSSSHPLMFLSFVTLWTRILYVVISLRHPVQQTLNWAYCTGRSLSTSTSSYFNSGEQCYI